MSRATRLIVDRNKKRKRFRDLIETILLTAVLVVVFTIPIVQKLNADSADTYINQKYVDYINQVCEDKHICPELVVAIIESESSGKANVVSDGGCVGLMQLDPRNEFTQGRNLFDWKQNIDAGTDYLLYLFEKYGEVSTVLAAYNTGEYSNATKNSINSGTIGPYTEKILKRAEQLERVHGK